MKLLVVTLVISSLLLPAKHLDKIKKNNSQRFLDKVQTIDPNAKFEIDQLKVEFQAQKDQIDIRYEQKRNTLKKQRKQEIDNLRNAYKNRLKRLEQKYPGKIKKQEMSTDIKRPLPLNKKDSKYLDPRESEVNDEKNGKEPKLDKVKRNLK